jgi:hypothetical protein
MKIYQNTYTSFAGSSCGFSYHGSKREAAKIGRETKVNTEGNDSDERVGEVKTELLIFTPTKKSILRLLNRVACHNDNG